VPTSTAVPATSTQTSSPTRTPTIDPASPGRCTEAVECNATSFSTSRSQNGCCDLSIQLAGLPFSWCPATAIDPISGQCSQCVAHPCQGLPTRTPSATPASTLTPTITPTETLTPTLTPTPIALGRCSQEALCEEASSLSNLTRQACCSLDLGSPSSYSWCPATSIEEETGHCNLCHTDPCEGLPTPSP